ncbi:MAG: major capsid protein [Cyanobacteria bacterium J06638_20]
MALTLIEAAKLAKDPLKEAVVSEFAAGEILGAVPFADEDGTGIHYNKVSKLPGIGFRGLNEAYSESTGVLNPQSEAFKIFGGDVDVDAALVAMKGQRVRQEHEQLKVESSRLNWEYQFIKGDSDADPRGFDGLQKRVTGSQLISNVDAGGALSLAKFDEVLSQVKRSGGRTVAIMNRKMRDVRLTAASRATGVGGFLQSTQDTFGRTITSYSGIPLLVDDLSNPVLPFTETSPDGSSSTACTSIYVVTFGSMMCTGIQGRNASGGYGIDVRDLGEIDAKEVYRTRISWNCSIAIYNGYSVARLSGITDAPVVA